MPVVEIKLLGGRSDEMKEDLIGNVTDSVAGSLGIPKTEVIVILDEMDKRHYAKAGISKHKTENS